jgi:hypothetical protein
MNNRLENNNDTRNKKEDLEINAPPKSRIAYWYALMIKRNSDLFVSP